MKTSFAIAAAGAVGLAIILRAAGYYAGADGLAFGISLVMAAALVAGIAELFWVGRRIGQLQAELQAFPPAATYDHVTRATPLLRALLGARLDRTALPVPGPTFAPFVVGLLVMLGLLGTFLGLFDTLRGAGQALTASTDVDGLRAGLEAPIRGLMRGFGTSAAGVASSAMLGLAMVFVRRDISRLGVSLHAMASGPLARFTPAHRQLLALETLAEQGAAWPKAAHALGEAVETLKSLEASWVRAHERAATRTAEQLETATHGIRGELQAAVAQGRQLAGDAATALSQLQQDWRQTHAETAERTQTALSGTAKEIGATIKLGIERTAEQTRAAVQPLFEATASDLRVRIDAAAEQMQRDLGQAASVVRERMQHDAQADRAQQARAEALLAQLTEASGAIAAAAQKQVGALQQFVDATDGRLRESEARSQERLEALLGRLCELADAQSTRLAAFETELMGQHADAANRLTESAVAHGEKLEQELQQTASLVNQAATLIHGGGIELSAVADAFAAAVDKQREGARVWLESLGEIERAVVDAGEAAAADVLGRHLARTHEVFDRQLQFQQELIDQLRGVRRDSALQARVDAAE